MADAQDAGTQTPPAGTDPTQGGGTPGAGSDGSEPSGKPVDAALALVWKEKAERVNAAEERVRLLEQRLDEAQRQSYGQAAPDPQVQALAELRQRASYDPDAARELGLWQVQAQNLAETRLTQALYTEDVPRAIAGRVADMVRQSGYQMSVQQAVQMLAPPENPEVASKLKSMQEENEKLRAQLASQSTRPSAGPAWAGGSGGGAVPHAGPTITSSEYAATLAAGGKRAADLRADMAANKVRLVRG